MPVAVVRRKKFDQIIDRNYVNAREKLYEQAKQVLEHDKLRESIMGFANSALAKAMGQGINQALAAGASVVKIEFSTAKAGQTLWKNWPPKLRQQVPADLVILALELVLSEAGFEINPLEHMFRHSRDLTPDDEPEEVEVVEGDEAGGENGTGETLEEILDSVPALTDSSTDLGGPDPES